MTTEEYTGCQLAAYAAARLLRAHDFRAAVEWGEQAEAVVPLLHPTAYKENGGRLAQDLVVLRACRDFVATIEAGLGLVSPGGG